jgi:hypothetical protein
MITTELYGRTGNNMFQVAAAIALAKRHNTSAYFIGNHSHLRGFKLKGISPTTSKSKKIFQEKMFSYDHSFESIGENSHLDGYFQSEKYFISAEDEIRKCFAFNHEVVDEARNQEKGKYKRFFDGEKATALHVRRTDYLNYPNIYPEFSVQYYNECIDRIKERGTVLIFSDDIEWCRNNLSHISSEFVEMQPMPSMYLMSNCANVIMANSTFSWWASWLGRPETVIYPKRWFGKKWPHQDVHPSLEDCVKDLFPSGWIGA